MLVLEPSSYRAEMRLVLHKFELVPAENIQGLLQVVHTLELEGVLSKQVWLLLRADCPLDTALHSRPIVP